MEAGIEQKVVINIAAFWGVSSCTLVHRYNLLSESSGQNAHYHSDTLRLVHNVRTTKLHGNTSQNFNADRRTRTRSFRNPRTRRRNRRVRTADVDRENMNCTVLWHQGETTVGSYRRVLVENNKKVSEELPSL